MLGWLTLPLLALLGFVAVCGTVVYSVAAPSLVPSLVPPQTLPAANARIELARTVAFAGGPALGGLLVGWIGAGPAFGFAAALSVIAVVLLAGIHEPVRPPVRAPPSAAGDPGGRGVRLPPCPAAAGLHHPVHLQHRLVPDPRGLRALCRAPSRPVGRAASASTLAMYGVGMVVGALLATRVMRRLPFGTRDRPRPGHRLRRLGGDLALTTVFPTPLLAGLGFFLLGAGPILWVISTTTLRQSVTPPRLLGRVSAINIMAYGARPLGAGLGALVGGAVRGRGLPLPGGCGVRRCRCWSS